MQVYFSLLGNSNAIRKFSAFTKTDFTPFFFSKCTTNRNWVPLGLASLTSPHSPFRCDARTMRLFLTRYILSSAVFLGFVIGPWTTQISTSFSYRRAWNCLTYSSYLTWFPVKVWLFNQSLIKHWAILTVDMIYPLVLNLPGLCDEAPRNDTDFFITLGEFVAIRQHTNILILLHWEWYCCGPWTRRLTADTLVKSLSASIKRFTVKSTSA